MLTHRLAPTSEKEAKVLDLTSVSKMSRYAYSDILVWIGVGGKANFEGDFSDRSEGWWV